MKPKAIHFDVGGEFLATELCEWLKQEGLTAQPTAPYSPLQNGVAECMNCTLAELAQAMVNTRNTTCNVPSQSCVYKVSETWYGKKPNVNNLCEFGAPIWILHQKQNREHKFEPKSLQRIFIGFNDGNKTIKYFNSESWKILTLRCYHFLTLSDQSLPLDNGIKIEIVPDVLCKGESSGRNVPQSDASTPCSQSQTRHVSFSTTMIYQ